MRRQLTLLDNILGILEQSPEDKVPSEQLLAGLTKPLAGSERPPWTDVEIIAHIRLLEDARFVEVDPIGGGRDLTVRLTWEGHDFLEQRAKKWVK